ncbi:MAG TPA: class I SAM-dependent methyltransferase [Methanospirillum sp.]|nr:class I SAM-dependent methyltransferase [Methanospirillum sp.]
MSTPAVQTWEEIYDSRLSMMNRDYQVSDWSERSEDYSESRKTDNYRYGRNVHEILEKNGIVSDGSRVIEVGSGPGTFVIPFAQSVAHVTAVEPAEGMMARIRENAGQASVSNFDIIPAIWQEVDTSSMAGQYDLAVSSTVIWMFRDIVEQIRRMEKVSSGYCCLCAGIDTNGHSADDLWEKVVGERSKPVFPEYPLIYSILYENGIYPEVRIIEHVSRRSPENMMKMHSVFYNLFTSMNQEKEGIIRKHVMDNLQDGQYIMRFKTAVLWWKPSLNREVQHGA